MKKSINVDWEDTLEKKIPQNGVKVRHGSFYKVFTVGDVQTTYKAIKSMIKVELAICDKMYKSTKDTRYQEAIETLNRMKEHIYLQFKDLKGNVKETWIDNRKTIDSHCEGEQ